MVDPNASAMVRRLLSKAEEAVARAGGPEAVVMEAMSAVVRFNAQRRSLIQQHGGSQDVFREGSKGGNSGAGSVESLLSEYLLANERDLVHDEEQLRSQGLSDAAIAQMMAQRRAQAKAEYAEILTNLQSVRHQTAMQIIGNIRY